MSMRFRVGDTAYLERKRDASSPIFAPNACYPCEQMICALTRPQIANSHILIPMYRYEESVGQ